MQIIFRIVGMRPFSLNMESINKAGDSSFLHSISFCFIYTLFGTNSCSCPHILYLCSLWFGGFGFFLTLSFNSSIFSYGFYYLLYKVKDL